MVAAAGLTSLTTSASAQVPFASADFHGYATGTDVHVDALQAASNGPQLANAEVAFSGASVASQGTGSGGAPAEIVNEMGQVVQPKLPVSGESKVAGNKSFGRGSGLEVGLGQNIPADAPQIPISKVRVSAPPNQSDDTNLVTVPAAPLAYAQAARGLASAQWSDSTCPLGNAPISFGEGYVAKAQLLSQSAASDNPMKDPLVAADTPIPPVANVSDAQSFELLAAPTKPNGDAIPSDGNGLVSETLETIAPVTLFQGTSNEVTIRVLGTWELKAVAGGVPGSAYVQYGPVGATPSTNILEVDTLSGNNVQRQTFTFQDVFGNGGLTIPASPLVTLKVGTPPHAIGGSGAVTKAADGTTAAGAVDVVSVLVGDVQPGVHIADLRVGHMEASATVPSGGVSCTIPITKVPSANPVKAGNDFTYDVVVHNTTDCVLDPAKVVDTLTGSDGVKFSILSEDPKASSASGNTLTWNNVGPIAAHGTKELTIKVHVDASSAAGTLTDHVSLVNGTCANGGGSGITGVVTGETTVSTVTGNTTVNTPTITPATNVLGNKIPNTGPLPNTGGSPVLPIAALAVLATAGGLARWRWARGHRA